MKRLNLLLAFLLFAAAPAHAETSAGSASMVKEPIKIGDMFAYTSLAAEAARYKKGWEQAVREVNAQGGVLGRPIEVISRDHKDNPEQGVLVAQDLIDREKVHVLAGTILAHVTNAIANIAGNRKIPLVTVWNTTDAALGKQNDYMYSVMTTESVALAAADYAAQLKAKKWVTIGPDFAYGQLAVRLFKDRLKKLRPDVEFVGEQWPSVGKIDAAIEVSSMVKAKPDAIFSCLFASDLAGFVRAGNRRNLFDDKDIVGLEAGARVYTKLVGKELRGKWHVTGDPSGQAKDPKDSAFIADYRKRFGSEPEYYTYAGYLVYKFIFAAIEKAGSTDPDKISKALGEVEIASLLGDIRMNPKNHRSNFGVWIGRLQPTSVGAELVDWEYKDATPYLGFDAK